MKRITKSRSQRTALKRCTKCGETKFGNDFFHDRSHDDGLSAWCADCYRWQQRMQRARRNGVKPEQVYRLIEAQDYKCAACGVAVENNPNIPRTWIDYRRGYRFPAGILCDNCGPRVNTVKNSSVLKSYLGAVTA